MSERFARSPAVSGELEVLCHPDRPNEPDTGAARVVAVDGDDWPELPASVPGVEVISIEELPWVLDTTYGNVFGPYWLGTFLRAVTAAFMIGVLPEEHVKGAVRFLATEPEVQQMVAAAGRLGVPPLEIFMIVEGRL